MGTWPEIYQLVGWESWPRSVLGVHTHTHPRTPPRALSVFGRASQARTTLTRAIHERAALGRGRAAVDSPNSLLGHLMLTSVLCGTKIYPFVTCALHRGPLRLS